MASRIGGPVYLGKPTAEVWRTDCKRECNRIICLNQLNVLVKEDEKDKEQNDRHVERGDRLGENRFNHVLSIKVYIMIARLRESKLDRLMYYWIQLQPRIPPPPRIMNLAFSRSLGPAASHTEY
jgi:hypothetical protein